MQIAIHDFMFYWSFNRRRVLWHDETNGKRHSE